MTHTPRWIVAAALMGLGLGASAAPAPNSNSEASTWQHRKAKFDFLGFTSAYTCDGLEGKVGLILKFFGARDPKVDASGCPLGPNSLSHLVWVNVEFDTLAAAPADAPSGDIVQARWTPFRLNAQRPFFMDEGDCELIDRMKPMLVANFSLRNLSYDAVCTPHEVTFADFRVNGEVLKSAAEHSG
jgi:hypothetical protein